MMVTLDGKITLAELRAYYPALAAVAEHGLRNPIEPDEAAWLDGPSFARWLHSHGLKPQNRLGDTTARTVRRWAEGDAVSLGAADEVLTSLGHHLSDVPDRCWRDRPPMTRGGHIPLMVKSNVVADRRAGMSAKDIAARYGVSERAVRKWVQQADDAHASAA